MAIIKCKMCGGDLKIIEGSSVCECTYCGTKQTVPSADNEKKLTLFARAGRLLRACEFDKASGVFETILADFPEEAEAYWGLVLCKYGIEYVDDPATGKKIPTCHRSSFDSVLDDPNFEQACENTDAVARRVYRDEARQIEELRQAILQVSGKEEPYDVFISYKETDGNGERTLDSMIAQDIYKELTGEGYRVFFSRISLEDKLGTEYEPYIFAALNSAKVMLVVGTDYENFDSVWVKNEWSRFLKLIAKGEKKTLIPVFKNMDAYDMPKEFAKLAAQNMGKVGAMQDLVRGVEKIVGKKKIEPATSQQPTYISNEADAKTAAAVKRGRLALEESDWSRAKGYFEQALTLDAECAEAYFGMALAEAQCRNAEEYINRAAGQTPESTTLSIPRAEEHIQKIVTEHAIHHYLDFNEILWHYNSFDRSYSSKVEGHKKCAEKEKQAFEGNRNIILAFRFAKGKYRETLENVKKALYSALEDNVRVAEQEEHEAARQKEEKYQEFLQKKDLEVEELYQKKLAERENAYLGLCKEFENANESYRFRSLKERFQFLGDYKDCEEYVKKCDSRIAELEEIERKERIERSRAPQYDSYSALCSDTVTETLDNLETAKAGFESLGEYRDAPARAQKCAERIEQIKKEEEAKVKAAAEEAERQRIAREKADAARKKKNIIIVSALGTLAVLAFAIFLIVTRVIIPGNSYKDALSLMEEGRYEEAIDAFEALNGYKDSINKIEGCKTAIKDARYDSAVELYKAGEYDEAIAAFEALDGYKDSMRRLASAEAAKAKAKKEQLEAEKAAAYENAEALLDSGDYDAAYALLEKIGNYNAIASSKYERAVALIDSGDYEAAYILLEGLTYKDSESKRKIIEASDAWIRICPVGGTVFYGSYEQDNNTANGKEDIEWIVLAKESNRVLVVSRYALDYQPFHNNSNDTTWEKCTLRAWLNGTFLTTAFSTGERAKILRVTVSADKNSSFKTDPGRQTNDQVFLLSLSEANSLLGDDLWRCTVTTFSKKQGSSISWDGCCSWWLRTPGINSRCYTYVHSDGGVIIDGCSVNEKVGVRPALWIVFE